MQRNRIIAISGKAGSGKDTVAAMLINSLSKQGHEFDHRKFAYKLKRLLGYALFGTSCPDDIFENELFKNKLVSPSFAQEMTHRQLLQTFAQSVREGIPDFWVNLLMREVDTAGPVNWVISDLRYQNEMAAIRERGGICIRIERPSLEGVFNHISELELDNAYFDRTIINDGSIEDLRSKVDDFIFNRFLEKTGLENLL